MALFLPNQFNHLWRGGNIGQGLKRDMLTMKKKKKRNINIKGLRDLWIMQALLVVSES